MGRVGMHSGGARKGQGNALAQGVRWRPPQRIAAHANRRAVADGGHQRILVQ